MFHMSQVQQLSSVMLNAHFCWWSFGNRLIFTGTVLLLKPSSVLKQCLLLVDHNHHNGVNDDFVPHHQMKLAKVDIDQYLLGLHKSHYKQIIKFCAC